MFIYLVLKIGESSIKYRSQNFCPRLYIDYVYIKIITV